LCRLAYVRLVTLVFFFFSSRRRHTRSKRDWSSDVCSSDLLVFNVVNKRERLNPVLATLASTDNEVITVGKHRSLGNTRPRFRGTVADMVAGILVQVQAVFGKRWPFGCQPVHRASTQMVAVAVSDKHGTNPTQMGAHVLDVKSNVNH